MSRSEGESSIEHKRVVGVSYDPAIGAPVVILKGAAEAADAILSAARKQGETPIVSNPELVDELYRTPIDVPVDRELFPVMAALLAHVFAIDRRIAERGRR